MNVILEGEGSWVGLHPVPSTPKVLDPKRENLECLLNLSHSFVKIFIKQKMQDTPNLRGGHLFGPKIWFWKDQGTMSLWSHGHSLCKIKNVSNLPRSYLVCFETLYPDP